MDPASALRARMTAALKAVELLPRPVLAIAAMLVLAGLDLMGAVLAKRWSAGGHALYFVAGVLTFVVLFCVYAKSLHYAELIPVTFGWIVILQVGLLVIGAIDKGARVPVGHWVAGAGIMALEGYLLFSSASP